MSIPYILVMGFLVLMALFLGGLTLITGVRDLVFASASKKWPSVPGTIVQSSVKKHVSEKSDGRISTTYSADVSYEFSVAGVVLAGSGVAYGNYGTGDSERAYRIVERYPVGKQVMVFYRKDDTEETILETGIKARAFFLPVIGSFFVGMGCLMAVSAFL